jgi:hypothetical protein
MIYTSLTSFEVLYGLLARAIVLKSVISIHVRPVVVDILTTEDMRVPKGIL